MPKAKKLPLNEDREFWCLGILEHDVRNCLHVVAVSTSLVRTVAWEDLDAAAEDIPGAAVKMKMKYIDIKTAFPDAVVVSGEMKRGDEE